MREDLAEPTMKYGLILLAALLFALACAKPELKSSKPSLQAAETAIMQLQPKQAEQILSSLLASKAISQEDQAKASTRLARMNWHVYGRLDEARHILSSACLLYTSPSPRD